MRLQGTGHPHRGGLLRARPPQPARALCRRSRLHRSGQKLAQLSGHPLHHQRRRNHGRRRHPSRLRFPQRERRLCGGVRSLRPHFAGDGRFALPGLAPHQALILESGYERNDGNYYFQREVQFPRGYTYYTGPNLTKLSSTYAVPLLYPDWSIGQLLYIKRIAANAFYDYGKVGPTLYRSTGAELVFDVSVLHWPGVRVGLREAYRLDYRNTRLNPFLEFGW